MTKKNEIKVSAFEGDIQAFIETDWTNRHLSLLNTSSKEVFKASIDDFSAAMKAVEAMGLGADFDDKMEVGKEFSLELTVLDSPSLKVIVSKEKLLDTPHQDNIFTWLNPSEENSVSIGFHQYELNELNKAVKIFIQSEVIPVPL